MKRKIVSVLLCVLLLASLLPVSAFADTTASGTCGDNLTWTLEDGTLTISGTGKMWNYDLIYDNGNTKTSAPWGKYYRSITNVVINDGITSIGSGAFYNCSSLTSVTIPDSVKSIGSHAFYNCSSLTSVTIPHGVTSIDYSAFSGCSSLTRVTIPDSVTSIGDGAFEDCGNLTSITVDKGNEYYCSDNGVLFSKDYERYYEDGKYVDKGIMELHTYPAGKSAASYIIPDSVASLSVTGIGERAFLGCSSLTSVTIPDSVTSIGDYAFSDCSSLTSVTIGNSVTSIGSWAFSDCSSLTSVTIPDSVTSIGSDAFYDCSSLTSVTMGNGVTSIEWGAFENCSSLTSVTIPDSVASIGRSAFENCSSLTSVTIPDSVTSIGYGAFSGCSSLTSVTIPDSVTSIEWGAFENCSSLTSVTIPDSVTSIGGRAFIGCSKIKVVNYDGNIESWLGIEFASSSSNPCDNGSNLYFKGELVTNAVIPDSVTSVGNYAFYNCSSLTSVTIPDSVTSIGSCAFYNCSSLTSVTIPHGVTSIGGAAFYNCSSLTSVTIGNGVTSIGERAFSDCSSLKSVTIPDSVTSIGDWAFRWCSKLKDIAFSGSKDAWASIEKGYEAFSTSTRIHYNCTTLEGHIIPMEKKDPSCTSTGYIKYSCACGYEFTELLPENHDYVFIKSVAATCSNAGYDVYKCSKCGKILNKSNGEEQLPHDYELTKAVEPTCTEHGYDVYTCAACGTSKTETRNDELLPHDYVVTVVEPTCLKGGYTLHNCSVCGYSYKDELTALLGHSMVEVSEKAPTCTEAGHTAGVQCSRCGLVESGVTEIPAIGHSYGNWTQTKAPTCTAKGTEVRTCTRCNATETRDVEALGHNTTHHAAKAATCTEIGWEAYDTCSRCDYTTYKEIPATGHHHDAVVTAPTCTEKGYTTHTCACGDSYVDSYTNALGHSYGNWTQTKAPTCTAKGTEVRTCTRCNATETRDVEALGHNTTHHAAKAPTCTESGFEAYDTCSRCDYTTYKEIPATGHHHDAVVTAPTCTEKGYTTHTCACGDSYVDSYTDALGHSYKNGKCTRCGEKDPNYVAAPVIKITTSAGKPKISWSKVEGAVKYQVYRSTDGKKYDLLATTTGTSITNTKAKIGTKYYYKVKAVNANGDESEFSNVESIKCIPATPTVTISRSGGKAKLSWKAVSGATKYWVYRSTDGKKYTRVTITTKLSYADSKSASGTKYYYKVMAVAVVNKTDVGSACSAVKSITTTLAKPTVKITTVSGKPKLSWSKVTGADKYYVYRSTNGKDYTLLIKTTKTSVTNTGAKKGTKYYYKVKAICSANTKANSAFSAVVSIKATK